jgi:hypothetical protein
MPRHPCSGTENGVCHVATRPRGRRGQRKRKGDHTIPPTPQIPTWKFGAKICNACGDAVVLGAKSLHTVLSTCIHLDGLPVNRCARGTIQKSTHSTNVKRSQKIAGQASIDPRFQCCPKVFLIILHTSPNLLQGNPMRWNFGSFSHGSRTRFGRRGKLPHLLVSVNTDLVRGCFTVRHARFSPVDNIILARISSRSATRPGNASNHGLRVQTAIPTVISRCHSEKSQHVSFLG